MYYIYILIPVYIYTYTHYIFIYVLYTHIHIIYLYIHIIYVSNRYRKRCPFPVHNSELVGWMLGSWEAMQKYMQT